MREQSRTFRSIGAAVALVLLCAAGAVAAETAAEPVSVQMAGAERRDLTRTIRLAASVEAFEQARLYAKVSGYVKAIHVDIGDTVRREQVLAELDVPEMQGEYEAAEARLAETRAMEAKAAADLELQKVIAGRSRGLREREAITAQDLEEAEAKHHIAAASLQLARAQVRSAEAGLVRLRALMDYARIKAPFDGVVTERFVDTGALLQAATTSTNVSPIVTVARVDQVRVFADVPEPEVGLVDSEDRATFVPNGPREIALEGRVTRFAGALNPATRTMRVEIDFPNPERRLLPGMYGTLSLAHPPITPSATPSRCRLRPF